MTTGITASTDAPVSSLSLLTFGCASLNRLTLASISLLCSISARPRLWANNREQELRRRTSESDCRSTERRVFFRLRLDARCYWLCKRANEQLHQLDRGHSYWRNWVAEGGVEV